jgi:hypothetical protein
MKVLTWLLVFAAIGVLGYAFWTWRQRWLERQRAAEERFESFMAQAKPVPPSLEKTKPVEAPSTVPQQRLLFEAAAKAGEAGEPALSIQLYARLLARYPESALGAQARAAIEAQKQRLAKA